MEFEKGEQGAYPTDSATVSDFRDIEATYYDYELVPTDATTFEIRAMGKDTMKGDIWVVKPAGVPTAVTDLCQ